MKFAINIPTTYRIDKQPDGLRCIAEFFIPQTYLNITHPTDTQIEAFIKDLARNLDMIVALMDR